MSSISKTDQLSARVSVKVPRPDSLVEVRVTPPDSNFQVKVSPGDDVIELLIRPGASMVEVRISPPGENELDYEFDQHWDGGGEDGASTEDEVVPGVSQAEFAALVEEEESAEAKKLLDQMAEAEVAAADSRPSPEYRLPEEVRQILESDQDDEDELNRLDEVLSPNETPAMAAEAPEELEALELSPEQAAEIPTDASEAAFEVEADKIDDEAAVAGPLPGDLAEVADISKKEEVDPPTVAGPATDEAAPAELVLAEPDEFDLPDTAEPAVDEVARIASPDESSEAEPDELDLPDTAEPAADEVAQTTSAAGADELDSTGLDNSLGDLTLENDEIRADKKVAPAAAKVPAPASASRTLEWVPVNPNGTPMDDDDDPIAPEVIGAAALDALARLNLAVREEHAAIEAAANQPEERPRPGETTAAASFFASADSTFTSADSTIMVEMYDDYEPGPNPADTMTPPPEDELMDLSQVERDDELAIDPIDVDGLGELDLEKSHFAETRNGRSSIKARPMIQVIPGNTVVPE